MSIGILPNVSSVKLNQDVKPGMSVYSRTTRLTSNQIKSQKKCHSHKGRESDDKNAVAIVSIAPQLGCVSQDSETSGSRKENSPGETDAESLRINSTSTVHPVYATSSKYPGKQRTIAWKNTSQTSSSAKSQRCEI